MIYVKMDCQQRVKFDQGQCEFQGQGLESSKDHETGHNEGQGQIQFWKYDHGVSQAKSELKVRLNV